MGFNRLPSFFPSILIPSFLALSSMTANVSIADELFDQGKTIFLEQATPSCTVCHTLADAGSDGEIGPNFNELQPTEDQVVNVLNSGSGIMPSFEGVLTPEQMKAVAHYVSTASRM